MDQPFLPQIVIKYSKLHLVWFVAMLLVFAGGIVLLIKGGSSLQYVMAVACIVISGIIAYIESRYITQLSKAQLTISANGLQISPNNYYPWHDVTNVQLKQKGSPKPRYALVFDTPQRQVTLYLDGLDKSPQQIVSSIQTYAARR